MFEYCLVVFPVRPNLCGKERFSSQCANSILHRENVVTSRTR